MTIPEVRAALVELIRRLDDRLDDLECGVQAVRGFRDEITELIEQLRRRPAVTRAPITSQKATAALVRSIRAYHAAHPTATQHAIATYFHVNSGRVSEALAGKRGS